MHRTKRIGIYVYENFEPIDVWGFLQSFAIARFPGQQYGDAGPYPFHISFIGNTMATVHSYNGPRVAPNMTRDEAINASFDLWMIPGGHGTEAVLEDAQTIPWVLAMDKIVPIMTSVCTGAAVLAKSGLLDGRPATTNHNAFDWVASFGPNVLWQRTPRWVDAGRYATSAGVSAGTDMGFYLVSRLGGIDMANAAAKEAEYHWQRDPNRNLPF